MHYIIRTLRKLTDPRQPWKIKHDLTDILAICIIATDIIFIDEETLTPEELEEIDNGETEEQG